MTFKHSWYVWIILFYFMPANEVAAAVSKSPELNAEERQWLQQHPVIQVGADQNWPPFDYIDAEKQHQGLAADYLKLIGNKLGVEFKVTGKQWKLVIDGIKTGSFEMLACAANTKERQHFLLFSDPYLLIDTVIVIRSDNRPINSLSDLRTYTVALPKGTYIHEMLEQRFPEIKLQFVKSNQEALHAVALEKADAYVGNLAVVAHFIEKDLLTNLKITARVETEKSALSFAVRKDLPVLQSILQKTLAVIDDQQRLEIRRRWIPLAHDQFIKKPLQLTIQQQEWLKQHPVIEIGTEPEEPLNLSAKHLAWLAQHRKITIGVDPNWPPIEFFDSQGSYQGIASDFVKLMEDKLNIELIHDAGMSWEQVVAAMHNGEIDVLPAVSITPEREKHLLFTRPYLKFPYVIFTRDDAPLITGLEELYGANVVVERNYANHELLQSNHPQINLLLVDNTEQALAAVVLGRADAYVGNLAATSHIIVNNGLANIKVAAPTPYSNDLAFAVRKDWPELHAIMQLVLDNITHEQSNAFKKKWFAIRYSHEIDYSLVWLVLLVALMVLLLFGVWLWLLRRQKLALAVSEQRFNLAMNAAKEGLWDWNILSGEVYFSPAYFEMLGYQQGELAGNHSTWEKLLHPNDRKKAVRRVVSAISQCAKHYEHEFRLKHKLGGYRRIHSFGSVVATDVLGNATRAVGTQVDVTEYHLAEKQLRQQEYALNTSSIVSIADAFGTITQINDKFCRISGYSAKELIGQNHKIFHSGYHSNAFWKEMFQTTAKGGSWRREICNKAKDGTLFWLDTTIVGLFDENNKLEKYISISSDITQRKLAQQQLAQAKFTAEQANRHKSDFLANMSHEIRTPMNAIIGMGHLLTTTDLSESQRDYVNKMQAAGQSLLILINDILDFSKIEAGKLHLESIDFDLNEVLNQISDLFRFEIENKGLEMVFQITPDTPLSLIGDPLRLRQVLINLVNNAVKFTHQGTIAISVSVVNVRTAIAVLRFSVKDQGIGIQAEQIAKLFDSFYQTDNSMTRTHGGTGLGLAICKNLVELMRGSIEVESDPGKGSIFSFTAEFGLRKQRTFKHLFEGQGLKGLRVLLVETESEFRNAMRDLLVSLSFAVTVADTAEQAINIAVNANTRFDIVFYGIQAQSSDCGSSIKSLKEDLSLHDTPLILIAHGHLQTDSEQLPIQAKLITPVTPSSLFDTVIKVFSGTGQETNAVTAIDLRPQNEKKLSVDLLLAEDNAVNRQVAQELLLKFGCSVDIAENGLEAVAHINRRRYDLVLMDIQMPVMDGLQATRKIRASEGHKDLPIIAMTAHAMQGDRQKSIAAGMNDHITKPIDPDLLYQMLRRWLPGKTLHLTAPQQEQMAHVELPASSHLIQIEDGLKRIGGNRKLLQKLLKEFYLDHQYDAELLVNALEQGDIDRAKRVLHTLNGVLGNIGSEAIYKLGLSLENSMPAYKDVSFIRDLKQFSKKFSALLEVLKPLQNVNAGYDVEVDYACHHSDLKIIENLYTLLDKGDFDALDYFQSVESSLLKVMSREKLKELKAALDQYDFEIALKLLEQLQQPR